MEKALVTGANGHIGSNLVRELGEAGYEVVALVREGADTRGLQGVDVSVVRGDVRDGPAVEKAVHGARFVFHLAAPYVLWAPNAETIVATAVQGTENVLRAARGGSVERVVVTGSCNAVGFTRGKLLDETSWREVARSPYIRAKLEQERRAKSLAEELGVDVVTVLPTAVLGPNDYKKTPTTGPFIDAATGKGPIPFAMNVVDARDVARGHRLAAERGSRGERYLLGGDNVDVPTLAGWLQRHAGVKAQQGLPPQWVLRAVAAVAEAASALSRKPPMITRAMLDDVGGGAPLFDITKARTRLGYEPRGAEEVVVATLDWARKMKWM
jgi:dihydroflavonol-4-reductase